MTLFYKPLIKYYHISGASLLDGVPEDLMEVIDPHWGQFPPQVKLFITSNYRQLSTDIKTSFVSPKRPKDRANKTGINFTIFILLFIENCL